MKLLSTFLFAILITTSVVAQEQNSPEVTRLTNKDIVELVKAGLSSDVIIAKIKTSRCNFNTDVPVLAELRKTGVPNEVIKAMIEAPYGPPIQTTKTPAINDTQPTAQVPSDSRTSAKAEDTPKTVTCGETRVSMPEVRGFRLGQTYQEVAQRFSDDTTLGISHSNKADEIGYRSEIISGIALRYGSNKAEAERFKDIRMMQLEFLDDRLISFQISYDSTVRWDNESEFTASIAKQLGLPANGWRNRYSPQLDCSGFSVITRATSVFSELKIIETGVEDKISARRKAAADAKRRAFKP